MKVFGKILILAAASILAACTSDKCSINGKVNDTAFEGATVILYNYENNTAPEALDTAEVKGGRFEMENAAEEPFVGILICTAESDQIAKYVIVEKGNVKLTMDTDELGGTPQNNALGKMFKAIGRTEAFNKLKSIQKEAYSNTDNSRNEELFNEYQEVLKGYSAKVKEESVKTFKANTDNKAGLIALLEFLGDTYPEPEPAEALALINEAGDVIKSNPEIMMHLQEVTLAQRLSKGETFKGFDGTIVSTGETANIESLIAGKVAVIDFWASWCAPCREEIEGYLIPLYEEYGSNPDFTLIGVAVGDQPEDHKAAVAELGIEYPQFFDTENVVGGLYGIRSIPYILVVDADGKIAASNVRGEEIGEAVRKALGN